MIAGTTKGLLQVLCAVLGREALPATDVAMVEGWLTIPGASPARLSHLIRKTAEERPGITSARYFDPVIRQALTVVSRETQRPRPRLLSERPWAEYLAHHTETCGACDEQAIADLRFRWERERSALGLPMETDDEEPCVVPAVQSRSELDLGPLLPAG